MRRSSLWRHTSHWAPSAAGEEINTQPHREQRLVRARRASLCTCEPVSSLKLPQAPTRWRVFSNAEAVGHLPVLWGGGCGHTPAPTQQRRSSVGLARPMPSVSQASTGMETAFAGQRSLCTSTSFCIALPFLVHSNKLKGVCKHKWFTVRFY